MENSRLAERENGMGKREDLGKEEHAISNGSLTGVGQREQQIDLETLASYPLNAS